MTDFGFLSVLPVGAYAALLLLIVSACILIFQRPHSSVYILAFIVLYIFLIHGTPNVLYGTLRYSWAWKHVGIIDYIQNFGSVDPSIAYLKVYHNWPGFFAFGAFFTDVSGIVTALNFAGWAPVFFNLLDVGALLLILTSLTSDRRVIWYALLTFYLTNWVGQDYFSPQAFAYFLHLVILGIVLRWFPITSPPSIAYLRRIPLVKRLEFPLQRFLNRAIETDVPRSASTGADRLAFRVAIIGIFGVIVTSHQITPVMTIMTLLGLAIMCQIRMRWFILILILMFVVWLLTGAATFMRGEISSILNELAHIGDHINANIHDTTHFNPAQVIVSYMVRGLTLTVLLLAAAGALRRFRNKKVDLAITLCAVAPFSVLVASSYGGEILFRVYFFALPFMSLLIALLLQPRQVFSQKWRTTIIATLLSLTLFVGFLFSYYGKDSSYYFTPKEVEGTDYLFSNAPPGTLIIEGSSNYPSLYHNYSRFTYVSISNEISIDKNLTADIATTFSKWMSEPKYTAAFVVMSRGQLLEERALGIIPSGTLENITQTLSHSPLFRVVYSNADVVIFRLANKYDASQP